MYVAEGATLLTELPLSCPVLSFYIKESAENKYRDRIERFPKAEQYVLSDDVFDSVADTVTPGGLIAVIKTEVTATVEGDTVALLDGVSDAGNVGTIIRTASARGIKTVFCIHNCADPYSPKAVRASMGGIFKVNVFETDIDEAKNLLEGYKFIALDMNGVNVESYNANAKKIVICVGNEAHGLSEEVKNIADDIVSIPMEEGGVESLNASVAMGIAMYMIKKGE